MKLCPICKENEALNQKRGGYCRPCNNEYGRQNYRLNKERYLKQAKKRDTQLDILINTYKAKPCMDCGVSYPPYVMDFDHRNMADKDHNISKMRRRRMSFPLIIAEIAKCDVVCANCHRQRTNDRAPARYSKS